MADIDYYELFGLSEDESEEEDELLETGDEEGDESENDDEVSADGGEGEEEEEDENALKEGNENERLTDDALRRAQEEVFGLIAELGIKGENGETLDTMDALRAAAEAKKESVGKEPDDSLREKLEESGFSDEEIAELLAGRSARAELSKLKEQKIKEDFERTVGEELSVISKFEPEISGVSDLSRLEHYDDFLKRVDEGKSFLEAYLLTHKDRLSGSNAFGEGVKNGPASKAHLAPPRARGGAAADLPDDVFEEYRRFNPHVTRAEAARHYSKGRK